MRSISQRELRNDNAAVVREVEAGESFVVTRRGVSVARIVPWTAEADLTLDRPARRRGTFADRARIRLAESTGEILDGLRGDR